MCVLCNVSLSGSLLTNYDLKPAVESHYLSRLYMDDIVVVCLVL